jgi:predicted GNAT family acetyltransferase
VFADAWVAANGVRRRPGWSLGGFKLTEVTPPARPARGTFRAARENDSDGLVRWAEDFFVETRHVGKDDPRQVVEERIREGRLFVWCDPGDRPACMAGWAGATPNGVRVNFVYTPPGNRGRGYAASCVAALSRHLLDSGRRFCFLFTNLENRTANKIYAEIGYRHVGDYRDVRFESRGGLGDD